MRNFKELNINEKGRSVLRQSPSISEIKAFEETCNVKLPSSYIELLNYSNGGHPELDSFVPIGSDPANTWAVNHFYFLNSDKNSSESIWKAVEIWKAVLGECAIPFASDAGGNQIFFDFSLKVKLCIHDQAYKQIDVADSFDSFIDLLSEDPDMI